MRPASSTSVGSGRAGSGSTKSPRGSGGGLKQRRSTSLTKTSGSRAMAGSSAGSMWKFYTGDDSPGFKIGPVPVLVMSLLFIACVFLLHIWGKYTRS